MEKIKVAYHGEVMPVMIKELPAGLKPKKPVNGYVVVADSEVTGNDHRVKVVEGIEFFEKDGVLYMKNTVPAELGCVIEERHDTELLPAGIWEFKKQLEYDPISEVLRGAID